MYTEFAEMGAQDRREKLGDDVVANELAGACHHAFESWQYACNAEDFARVHRLDGYPRLRDLASLAFDLWQRLERDTMQYVLANTPYEVDLPTSLEVHKPGGGAVFFSVNDGGD